MESLIEKIPVHVHNFESDQIQLRLVDNQKIKSLEDEIKSLKKIKAQKKFDNIAKMNLLEKNYVKKVKDLQTEHSELISEGTRQLEEIKIKEKEQEEEQSRELGEIEEFQQKELKTREQRFDKTLQNEHNRYYKLREDLDEMKLQFDSDLNAIVSGHEGKMKALEAFYSEKFSQVQESYNTLLEIMKKDSTAYESQISQLEEEHEREVHLMREKKENELRQEKIKSEEYNKLRGSQKELKVKVRDEKDNQKKELEKLEDTHNNLASEVEDLRNKLNKTEEQIKEREDVISRKEDTIKELRAFNIHLLNFHFVLNQKIASLKEERDPLDRKIKDKESSIRDMYNELLEEFSRKNSLKERSGKLRDKNKAVEELNNSLRNQIFQNKRKMTLFQSELSQMIRTTEKKKLVQALKELYDKQIKRANTEETDVDVVGKNTDVRETLIEASFQKSQKEILKYHGSVKERLNSIQKQNKQYQKEKTQAIFKKQHENAYLISTCNELRNEKQKLLTIISKLKGDIKELNALTPNSNNLKTPAWKNFYSASAPMLTDLPVSGVSQNFGFTDKINSKGKLQSIVNQLDKTGIN